MEKYGRVAEATDGNMGHALRMLDNYGYRHALRICNTYCFSTATVVTGTRLSVTLQVHCPSSYLVLSSVRLPAIDLFISHLLRESLTRFPLYEPNTRQMCSRCGSSMFPCVHMLSKLSGLVVSRIVAHCVHISAAVLWIYCGRVTNWFECRLCIE